MIISQTPYRVSFFGGGTDYPAWYKENGGHVLSTAIDKYVYISCRYLPPFFEHRLRLVYSKVETCQQATELIHPAARETLRFLNINSELEIHYDGDLPARSGMGSSSAFTVGLLNALYAYIGETTSPRRLSEESIYIEQVMVKEQVGSQDQVCAAYGGLNKIEFHPSGDIVTKPIAVDEERVNFLNRCLMLFFTGDERTAADIAETYVADIASKARQLEKIYAMVDDAEDILSGSGNLDDFGWLLHEAWVEKRSLSRQVSNSHVDEIYNTARSSGALGGKLLGAGGGGMFLFFVPLERQTTVREALSDLIHIPFQFESSGSRIILRDKHQRYEESERWRSKLNAKLVDIKVRL